MALSLLLRWSATFFTFCNFLNLEAVVVLFSPSSPSPSPAAAAFAASFLTNLERTTIDNLLILALFFFLNARGDSRVSTGFNASGPMDFSTPAPAFNARKNDIGKSSS